MKTIYELANEARGLYGTRENAKSPWAKMASTIDRKMEQLMSDLQHQNPNISAEQLVKLAFQKTPDMLGHDPMSSDYNRMIQYYLPYAKTLVR